MAQVVAGVFAALGLAHVFWAMGVRLGGDALIPRLPSADGTGGSRPAFTPSATATLAVAAALFAVAAMVGLRAGFFATPLNHPALRATIGLVALAMFIRAVGDFRLVGFFKRIKGSSFARMDSWVYSPLCVALGLGLAAVALG